jgi:uncharacterized membrane protein YfbV (UPF0208 family)
MANPSVDEMRLQLAMAFGQGAGAMLASPEALTFALAKNASLIRRASADWDASQCAFMDLVRRLGQISATLAIVDKKPEIGKKHVMKGVAIVLNVCPCGPLLRGRQQEN